MTKKDNRFIADSLFIVAGIFGLTAGFLYVFLGITESKGLLASAGIVALLGGVFSFIFLRHHD